MQLSRAEESRPPLSRDLARPGRSAVQALAQRCRPAGPSRRPLPYSVQSAVVLLLLLSCAGPLAPSPARAFVFPVVCNTTTTLTPGAPGSVGAPAESLCPQCCKQPLNLSFSATPSRSFPNVANAERCILLCSAHDYWAATPERMCNCYDECSEEAQRFRNTDPHLVGLGKISACFSSCFPLTSAVPWCGCPQDAKCIPGPAGSGQYRCCCDQHDGVPTVLPDGTTLCLAFQLGADLIEPAAKAAG